MCDLPQNSKKRGSRPGWPRVVDASANRCVRFISKFDKFKQDGDRLGWPRAVDSSANRRVRFISTFEEFREKMGIC